MTYEEKKAWLRRYRKAARLEKIKLEEVEQHQLRVHWRYDVDGLLRKLEGKEVV